MEYSTRLSIVEHALLDVVERLDELPRTDTEALRRLAEEYAAEMSSWEENPPGEAKRAELLKCVLDLNVEVIRAGGRTTTKGDETDVNKLDDDYPKSL